MSISKLKIQSATLKQNECITKATTPPSPSTPLATSVTAIGKFRYGTKNPENHVAGLQAFNLLAIPDPNNKSPPPIIPTTRLKLDALKVNLRKPLNRSFSTFNVNSSSSYLKHINNNHRFKYNNIIKDTQQKQQQQQQNGLGSSQMPLTIVKVTDALRHRSIRHTGKAINRQRSKSTSSSNSATNYTIKHQQQQQQQQQRNIDKKNSYNFFIWQHNYKQHNNTNNNNDNDIKISEKSSGIYRIKRDAKERELLPDRINFDKRGLTAIPIIENEPNLRLLSLQHNLISTFHIPQYDATATVMAESKETIDAIRNAQENCNRMKGKEPSPSVPVTYLGQQLHSGRYTNTVRQQQQQHKKLHHFQSGKHHRPITATMATRNAIICNSVTNSILTESASPSPVPAPAPLASTPVPTIIKSRSRSKVTASEATASRLRLTLRKSKSFTNNNHCNALQQSKQQQQQQEEEEEEEKEERQNNSKTIEQQSKRPHTVKTMMTDLNGNLKSFDSGICSSNNSIINDAATLPPPPPSSSTTTTTTTIMNAMPAMMKMTKNEEERYKISSNKSCHQKQQQQQEQEQSSSLSSHYLSIKNNQLHNNYGRSFENLIFLDLYDNQIERITNLDGLSSLMVLLLGKNRIYDVSGLISVRRTLRVLDLHGNRLTNLTNKIHYLNELKSLNLAGNQLRQINHNDLNGLMQLKELNLKRNRLKRINGFQHLKSLERLWLCHNDIHKIDDMSSIAKAEQLLEVTIENNPISFGGDCVSYLVSYLPKLQSLCQMPITEQVRKAALVWRNNRQQQHHYDHSKVTKNDHFNNRRREEIISNARTNWELLRAQQQQLSNQNSQLRNSSRISTEEQQNNTHEMLYDEFLKLPPIEGALESYEKQDRAGTTDSPLSTSSLSANVNSSSSCCFTSVDDYDHDTDMRHHQVPNEIPNLNVTEAIHERNCQENCHEVILKSSEISNETSSSSSTSTTETLTIERTTRTITKSNGFKESKVTNNNKNYNCNNNNKSKAYGGRYCNKPQPNSTTQTDAATASATIVNSNQTHEKDSSAGKVKLVNYSNKRATSNVPNNQSPGTTTTATATPTATTTVTTTMTMNVTVTVTVTVTSTIMATTSSPVTKVTVSPAVISLLNDREREQGGDYLIEICGRHLNIYGQGALRYVDKQWNPTKANDVHTLNFSYINFNNIVPLLHRIKVRFPNSEHFIFRETNIEQLGQLNALAELNGLHTLFIDPEGNGVTSNELWRQYTIYRLHHWGLNILNGQEVTSEEIVAADTVYKSLTELIFWSIPESLLQPLLIRLSLEESYTASKLSIKQWLLKPDHQSLRLVVCKEALQWKKPSVQEAEIKLPTQQQVHQLWQLQYTDYCQSSNGNLIASSTQKTTTAAATTTTRIMTTTSLLLSVTNDGIFTSSVTASTATVVAITTPITTPSCQMTTIMSSQLPPLLRSPLTTSASLSSTAIATVTTGVGLATATATAIATIAPSSAIEFSSLSVRERAKIHLTLMLENTCNAIEKLYKLETLWPSILLNIVRNTLIDYSQMDAYVRDLMNELMKQ